MAKIKCICDRSHARANALAKAPKVVGKAFDPNGLVRAMREAMEFVQVSSGRVDDCVFFLSRK